MLIGQKGVKYGLDVRGAKPKAKPTAPVQKRSVFGDEDSDEDAGNNVEQQIARQAARKQTDKKVAQLHADALTEDAAIFDYDSHFDSIQEARAEPKKQEKLARQSRYIAGLLEKAEERKAEQDILYERQLAKERAAEDHLFGDKEKFVTAAYKAKLAERAAWQEEQKRKKEAEEADAVEKRGHMGDFYRNLLRSNVAFGGKEAPAGSAAPTKQQQQQHQQHQAQEQQRGAEPAAAAAAGQQQQEEEPEEPQWLPREQGEGAASASKAAPAAQAAPQAKPGPGPSTAATATAAAVPEHYSAAAPKEATAAAAEAAAAAGDAGVRRNQVDSVAAARERYLARKRQKLAG